MTQACSTDSPFGPPTAWNLDGWMFGAFVKGLDNQHHGFFIDPRAVEPRMRAFAELRPGCTAPTAFMAAMLPPRVECLLEHWQLGWRERPQLITPRPSRQNSPLSEASPRSMGTSDTPEALRFAFISAAFTARVWNTEVKSGTRDPYDYAHEDAANAWREELSHLGVSTAPWHGRDLMKLGNGFRLDEISASAREQAQNARLCMDLKRDLPKHAASARRSL